MRFRFKDLGLRSGFTVCESFSETEFGDPSTSERFRYYK